MAFPPAFLDELTMRNPIEDVVGQYVALRRSGSNLFGLCPFHGEKTASFSVAPDKGIYYCFGCHKGGNAVNFMMEVEGLSYPDAVRALAKRAGMEVPEDEQYQSRYKQQERLWALHKEAARFFHTKLYSPEGAEALIDRGATGITNLPSRIAGVTSFSTSPSLCAERSMLYNVRDIPLLTLDNSRLMFINPGDALSRILPKLSNILSIC